MQTPVWQPREPAARSAELVCVLLSKVFCPIPAPTGAVAIVNLPLPMPVNAHHFWLH